MYQLHITIQEFPSCHRVHFAFSATDERGKTRPFGTREVWVDTTGSDLDPLEACLQAAKRACQAELRPKR